MMKSIYILSYMSWCSWRAHSKDCGKGPMEVETSAKPKPCKGNDKTHPLALEGGSGLVSTSFCTNAVKLLEKYQFKDKMASWKVTTTAASSSCL